MGNLRDQNTHSKMGSPSLERHPTGDADATIVMKLLKSRMSRRQSWMTLFR